MTARGEILVVDDDPDIRTAVRLILEKHGYVVKTAANGKEALKAIDTYRPDLIILDLIMSTETEGYDVACSIKNNPQLSNIPIIMLTCFLEKVRKEGPNSFQNLMGEEWPAQWLFEKPVDTKKLLAKIEGLLAESK